VLRWLVAARNHVVKEGDLATFSTATAGIQASWDEPEVVTFQVPPLAPTLGIAATLTERNIPEDIRKSGLLRVERRWVAETLPEWELLDALGHCYGLLSHLITDAHRQAGSSMHTMDMSAETPREISTEINGERLPCMVASEETRTVVINLRTNEILPRRPLLRVVDPKIAAKTLKRYGPPPSPPDSDDPLEWAPFFLEHAKRVLARDKWHAQYACVFASFASAPNQVLGRDGVRARSG
jgi:hypothetical protein